MGHMEIVVTLMSFVRKIERDQWLHGHATQSHTMGLKISKHCCCTVDGVAETPVVETPVDVEETRIVKMHPSRMHARNDVLMDGFAELAPGVDMFEVLLPCNVNVGMAAAYIAFIEDLIPPPFPNDSKTCAEWDTVEGFFGCGLHQYPGTRWLQELYAANPGMGKNASLEWINRRTVFKKMNPEVTDPYMFLTKVKDVKWEDMVELDLEHCCIVKPERWRLIPSAIMMNKGCERFKAELPGFPWFAENGKQGAIIAGGRTVALLHNTTITGQDVDIFVVAPDLAAATKVVDSVVGCITKTYKDFVITTGKHTFDINIFALEDNAYKCVEKFQIILRVFPSPSHVVHGFDIDVCGVLYDGDTTWCTQNAARAMNNGFNLLDENKLSSSAVYRYAKYAHLYGYAVMAAGIPQAFMATPVARCLTDLISATGDGVDVFSVQKLMRDHAWKPTTAPRDYEVTTYERILKPNTVTYEMIASEYKVFTGAFNPIVADTLARYNKYKE
jgi:hypothetical protein